MAANKTQDNGSNKTTTTKSSKQENGKDNHYESKYDNNSSDTDKNIGNIHLDMGIDDFVQAVGCNQYLAKFKYLKVARNIVLYTQEEFKDFLKTRCKMDIFSPQFVNVMDGYHKLHAQQNMEDSSQANGM